MGMKNQVAPSSLESDTPGSQAQEELRNWLETRLDVLGIHNPSTLSRIVLDFLCFPISALSGTSEEALGVPGSSGGDGSLQLREQNKIRHDSELRQILVDNLMNICDQIYPINMLVDELCLKLRRLRESCSSRGKPRHTRFTDELEDSLAAFVLEGNYACNTFPILPFESDISNFLQQEDRNICNNNTRENRINLRNAENGRTDKGYIEEILKPVTGLSSFHYADVTFTLPTPANMQQDESRIDASCLTQLIRSVFNEKVEAIWQTNSADTDRIRFAQEIFEEKWPSYVWPQLFNSSNDSLIQELTSDAPVISWAKIFHDDAVESGDGDSNYGTRERDPVADMVFEEHSILLDEPINAAGHSIWSRAAAETDNSWVEFFDASANPPVAPEAGRPPVLSPQSTTSRRSPVEDREKVYAFLAENLPEPEDLLTSPRTHFRPIRDDREWADGTTFSIDNSVERIAYRRSESGRLYLPGSETPHMEYRENIGQAQSESFVIRFRVRQHDQAVQTDFTDEESITTESLIADMFDSDSDESELELLTALARAHSDSDSETDSETVSESKSERNSDCRHSKIEQAASAFSKPCKRRLMYTDGDSDDSSGDLPLGDPSATETGIQQREEEEDEDAKDEAGASFDIHFPPLRGHSPSTSSRLKAVIPVHYSGDRRRTFVISRRIKIIPIHKYV